MLLFERRRINIRSMNEGDVDHYYEQIEMDETEKKNHIKEIKKIIRKSPKEPTAEGMLLLVACEPGNNRMIGTILTKNLGKGKISLQVSFPNKSKEISYGKEVVDQFIKVCKKEPFFETIKYVKLDAKSEIIQKYMNEKEITSSFVCVE